MKDKEKPSVLLRDISWPSGITALNKILTPPNELSFTQRNYCLKFFIQEKISTVHITEMAQIDFRLNLRDEIPTRAIGDDILSAFIKAVKISEEKSFFSYDGRHLLLVVDFDCREKIELVLSQMGLNIIYYFVSKHKNK